MATDQAEAQRGAPMARRGFLAAAGGAAATAGAVGAFGTARLAWAQQYGSFDGDFIGRFLGNARAVVEAPLTFTDPGGQAWTAPAGVEVNGASIPRALWSIVGSPFAGAYLRASVIHDHYCVTMERPWRETHLAFWYGCRADGVSKTYANLLYAGVMRFGPRWRRGRGLSSDDAAPQRIEPAFDQAEFDELLKWVEENDPALLEIENRAL